MQKIEKIHFLYIATFLFIITLVAFGNTLFNQLFFDDEQFIYKNLYVQNFSVLKYFSESVTSGAGVVSNYYRPLLLLTYGIEHKLFSNLSFIYHLDNLLIHAGSGILLFIFLKRLLGNTFIPLLTSTLFLIHPIQTEAVSYASGRNDPLSAVFIFLTLILFFREGRYSRLFATFFFVLALLSREPAVITPALIFIADLYKTKSFTKTGGNIPRLAPLIAVVIIYFFLRLTVLNFQNTLNFYQTPTPYSTNVTFRLFTFLSVLPTYIGLLFFPKTLFIDRSAEVIRSPLNISVITSLAFIIFLGFFSLKIFKKNPLFLFSFLWFFVAFLPTSGIIPINGIIYEHFLYLPSIGIFLGLSLSFFLAFTKIKNPTVLSLFLIFLLSSLLTLTVRTIMRNKDWRDPITFYTKTIENSPISARLHNNLAMALSEKGKIKEAIKEYKTAINICDCHPQTHFNLANAYLSLNRIDEAKEEYKKAIKIDPSFIKAYLSLAQILKILGEEKELKKLENDMKTLGIYGTLYK